ncbi:hypothetical protein OSTOST_25124 [Ostertagia ostertagi]
MTEQLVKYMEKLDDLPPFICKSAEEMRELDEKVEKLVREIELRVVAQVKKFEEVYEGTANEILQGNTATCDVICPVQAMYKEVDKLSERKVKLAQKMYDTVDTHIKEMDQQITDFHEVQRRKYKAEHGVNPGPSNSTDSQKKRSNMTTIRVDKRKKPMDAKTSENAPFVDHFKQAPLTSVDMPVDPNEPTYCICHQACTPDYLSQMRPLLYCKSSLFLCYFTTSFNILYLKVSFGQMVACDGPDCKNEWFHFHVLV